jgi:transcriptional regulator with XRE-family HTH domain
MLQINYLRGIEMAQTVFPHSFAVFLRRWRTERRYSQLELASRSNISQRHLSFLESGRSSPSRAMVLQLSQALNLPLQARNQALLAAGFAPLYPRRDLEDAGMRAVRDALIGVLTHHEPLPAMVVNRQWDVVLHNAAFGRLLAALGPPEQVWATVDSTGRHNLMRLTFHPKGLQPHIEDWPGTAQELLARLRQERDARPDLGELADLFREMSAWLGTGHAPAQHDPGMPLPPVLSLRLRAQGQLLALFSMVCSFGSAQDVMAEDLRLELMFPSDPATDAFFRQP